MVRGYRVNILSFFRLDFSSYSFCTRNIIPISLYSCCDLNIVSSTKRVQQNMSAFPVSNKMEVVGAFQSPDVLSRTNTLCYFDK